MDDRYSPFWVIQYVDEDGNKQVRASYYENDILGEAIDIASKGKRVNVYLGYFGLGNNKPVTVVGEMCNEDEIKAKMQELYDLVKEMQKSGPV